MYERDTYRDDVITMNNNLELRLPFLDTCLVEYALKIPEEYKIHGERTKIILRDAAKKLGLAEEISERKKKAAQYGSNSHKIIKKLPKKAGFEFIADYLRQFYPKHNLKLGALVSSGKDSLYALYVMQRQNYKIACMITLKSKNPDSYMFHTPTIDLVKLQSESSGIPIVEFETKGEKEKELEDLKKALEKAKKEYNLDGITTGALFSNYQRERIEKIADELGLKLFSPLWHIDQETEIREIINQGFKFIITKVAAEGLDKTWLNRIITNQDVDKLIKLNQKAGLNIAFEGGEAETLVLDAPFFKKQIKIEDYEVKQDGIVATLIIKKAKLTEK
jgi:asparagine synthase (glutamine-hydrolysing)